RGGRGGWLGAPSGGEARSAFSHLAEERRGGRVERRGDLGGFRRHRRRWAGRRRRRLPFWLGLADPRLPPQESEVQRRARSRNIRPRGGPTEQDSRAAGRQENTS